MAVADGEGLQVGSHLPSAARPTLFIIPGMCGENPRLAALREDWSATLDCVALEYPDWPLLASPGYTMEQMEANFIARIAQRAAHGPLLLAGYSLGGFIAWSLARRLAGAGRPAAAVFIVDTDIGQLLPELPRAPLAVRIRRFLDSTARMLFRDDPGEFNRTLGRVIGIRLSRSLAMARRLADYRHLWIPQALRGHIRYYLGGELQARIVRAWQMAGGTSAGVLRDTPVFVLWAAAEPPQGGAEALGWQTRCAVLSMESVAGDHQSLLQQRGLGSLYQRLPLLVSHVLMEHAPGEPDRAISRG